MGAIRRVVIDASVALVRAYSVPPLVAGKIHLLLTVEPSSLQVCLVLTQTCSRPPLLLWPHSIVSRVFVEVQLPLVRSRFLVLAGSHSRAFRTFAGAGLIRVYPRFPAVSYRVSVEVEMLQASHRSLGMLYSHLKVCRVSFGAGRHRGSVRFLPVLYSHLKIVLSFSVL